MLQVNTIRQDIARVKERLAVKNFSDPGLVDKIIALDDERKKLQSDFETLQSKVNSSSKAIGQLIAKGQKDEAENAKKTVAGYKLQISDLNEKLAETEKQLTDELVKLPNLPS